MGFPHFILVLVIELLVKACREKCHHDPLFLGLQPFGVKRVGKEQTTLLESFEKLLVLALTSLVTIRRVLGCVIA